ncbi:MAG: ABC transporter permease [Spirochaetes bacterium]|nr:ABC transporter permease [Spirochaetota bacterium]
MKKNKFTFVITVLVLLFFYFPITILVVNSFNSSRFGSIWGGFSLKWYDKLFNDRNIWQSLKNTLIVAGVSTSVSMILGTLSGYTLFRYKSAIQKIHVSLIALPLIIPDILMGMSLLLFFIALKIQLSLITVILGHITFCVSYVAVTVLARLQDFDFNVVEAAQDLGASSGVILRKIYLPLLAPGLISGGMLALTLSLDDFIITFFTAGPGSSTLPLQIYSMIKFGTPPVINALSTLFLLITFLIALLYQRINTRRQ